MAVKTDRLSRLESITGILLAWYADNKRPLPWRDPIDPYHTWISEIMLQQTRIDVVIDYYHRFLEQFPDIPTLASASEDALLKAWEGLGYYNRVRNIGKAARMIMEEYGGQFPGTKAELMTLPGIGEYTAAAISSIVFGRGSSMMRGMSCFLLREKMSHLCWLRSFPPNAPETLIRLSWNLARLFVFQSQALTAPAVRAGLIVWPLRRELSQICQYARTACPKRQSISLFLSSNHLTGPSLSEKGPSRGFSQGCLSFPTLKVISH